MKLYSRFSLPLVMELLQRFNVFLTETVHIEEGDKVVLAVSGGRDSMLMAHLFVGAGYDCVIAHCNFQLRGAEADADEALVQDYAAANDIPFYANRFDTIHYAEEEGISIQMAARDLRYAWFEKLRQEVGAKWVAVAQHLNDHIETVLLNLTRGTGLLGLQGILPKRGAIIRPILFLTASEVLDAVQRLQISYRDDQSNFSTQYARNKIRLEIVPKFKDIAPDFEQTMQQNILHFQETNALLQSFITPIRERLFIHRSDEVVYIKKEEIGPYTNNLPLLFELFRPWGFTKEVLGDLLRVFKGEPGRVFYADEYALLLDRDSLLLKPVDVKREQASIQIDRDDAVFSFGGKNFTISYEEKGEVCRERGVAQIDADLLIFPLQMRYWHEGDYFVPLGMSGRKKLSDFFIQEKLNLFEKKEVLLLVNGNDEIIWLVNYRLDNRYKMTGSTKKVFTLVCK